MISTLVNNILIGEMFFEFLPSLYNFSDKPHWILVNYRVRDGFSSITLPPLYGATLTFSALHHRKSLKTQTDWKKTCWSC